MGCVSFARLGVHFEKFRGLSALFGRALFELGAALPAGWGPTLPATVFMQEG